MPATVSIARRTLVPLATVLLSGMLLALPAGAAQSARPRQDVAHHHVKDKAACAARTARTHRAHRRAACARTASVPMVQMLAPAPQTDVPADGTLRAHVKVHSARKVDYVAFKLDGKVAKTDRKAAYSFSRKAKTLEAGPHRVRAVAVDGAGHHHSVAVTIDVTGAGDQTPPTDGGGGGDPSDTSDTAWAQGKTWTSSFESGTFGEWSWWGQGDSSYGHRAVVDPVTEGVPRLGGDHVVRFETTPDDIANGRIHAKLYRGFGSNLGEASSRPPADVSGTYSAWYYLPETYHVPDHTAVNMFQFKEEYQKGSGTTSDPLWWVQLGPVHWADGMARGYGEPGITGRSDAPVAFLNYWNSTWGAKRNFVPVPLGRWFEIKAVVHQGQSTDFYMDGKLLDTARASTYPVSPFHGADSRAWTFGIGNYSTGANGPMYADRASYTAG